MVSELLKRWARHILRGELAYLRDEVSRSHTREWETRHTLDNVLRETPGTKGWMEARNRAQMEQAEKHQAEFVRRYNNSRSA